MTTNNGPLDRLASVAATAFALASVAYHLWLVFAGLLPNLVTRPLHMFFALPFVFLFGIRGSLGSRLLSYALGLAGMAICLWIILNQEAIGDQYGSLEGPFQFAVAIALIAVVFEMARRAIKLVLPMVALLVLVYGLLGPYVPGQFGHQGIPLDSFFGTLVIAEGGIWGSLTGISVSVIAVFLVLGALVSAGEAGTGFMALAMRIAGRFRAGAAKVSVLASAFFGSISGSASANVASVGSVTIPTMKRLGYPAALAGAVEAVASTGGQIMPPMMGAGAFVMVEVLGVSYNRIMAAAILPAILFFWTAWAGVDHFARHIGLKPMSEDELPTWRMVLRTVPFFLVPFGGLLAILFLTDRTPEFAAGIAVAAAALMLAIDGYGRFSLRLWVRRLLTAAVDGARQIASIAAIVLCAGIIIGVLNQTGLGIKITSLIINLSGGNLWAALGLTALACIALGMEVPTTAAYVICISVAGPALENLGMPALHAHLFVFWYALLSTITPPVCGTVYIAAGMAGAPWLQVAARSTRIGLGLYFVPLAFVPSPALLDPLGLPLEALFAFVRTGAGLWLLSAGVTLRWRSHLANAAATFGGMAVVLTPF